MPSPASKIRSHMLVIACTSLSWPAFQADAAQWHSHASIERAAERVVAAELGPGAGRIEVVADALDTRLRLARCGQSLEASLPYGVKRKSRVTAEVRCTGPVPWKLFVPVRLEVWQQVLVATGPLQRGTLLTAADLRLAERSVTDQARGFVLRPSQAVGFRLKRNLAEGDVLTPGAIVAPPLIQRGQRVTLEANGSGLRIQMAGTALEAGMAGDIIGVENNESGRRIEGVVRSAKSVEVLLR